jgi:hypothetical protein
MGYQHCTSSQTPPKSISEIISATLLTNRIWNKTVVRRQYRISIAETSVRARVYSCRKAQQRKTFLTAAGRRAALRSDLAKIPAA